MRIVGGELGGRHLVSPASSNIRPTSDRLREALFDILVHRFADPVTDARVLDLFAGTGALGLEALSRGGRTCLMVEQSVEGRGIIRNNIEALGLTGRARIYRRDATRLGDVGTLAPFDVVFADPPYGRSLGEAALASAAAGGWLTPGALCVLEEAAATPPQLPPGFAALMTRRLGESVLIFARCDGKDSAGQPI